MNIFQWLFGKPEQPADLKYQSKVSTVPEIKEEEWQSLLISSFSFIERMGYIRDNEDDEVVHGETLEIAYELKSADLFLVFSLYNLKGSRELDFNLIKNIGLETEDEIDLQDLIDDQGNRSLESIFKWNQQQSPQAFIHEATKALENLIQNSYRDIFAGKTWRKFSP